MCRSGSNGRRCPGQDSASYREARNAQRRASYAAAKTAVASVTSESSKGDSTNIESLNLPITTGREMSKFEFKSRLPQVWNPNKFTSIGNGVFNEGASSREKPSGGLWSSPIDRDADEEVSEYDILFQIDPTKSKSVNHDVTFTPDAKVLIVDTRSDYDSLLSSCGLEVEVDGTVKRAVNYERLSQEFDAVYFTTKAVYANGRSNPSDEYFASNVSLSNFDIASLFIMNPQSIAIKPE